MKIRLLHKTLRVYIGYSIIVLLVSAPLFYWLTERLYIEDADETLFLRKREFLLYDLPTMKEEDVAIWNRISRDLKIEHSPVALKRDSIFYTFYVDSLANENEPYRVLLTPIVIENQSFILMAKINLVESEDMIKAIAILFCLILSVLLVGLYFITRRLSSTLWSPFYSTLEQVEKFDIDKSVQPVFAETTVEEFSRLNQSINRLLEKNTLAYKSQQEFTENAAHELQTPLAVLQAKLDLLAQQVPMSHELGETLSKLNEAASRLHRINKNLLLLSKIEHDQYSVMEDVLTGDLIKKQIDFLTEQARERNIEVQVRQIDSPAIKANAALLDITISNLFLNALRHNFSGGRLVIDFSENVLTISNSSVQGVLDGSKIFQRFTSPGQDGGSGLGLSIVKKIADVHRWKLTYSYHDRMHIFQLVF